MQSLDGQFKLEGMGMKKEEYNLLSPSAKLLEQENEILERFNACIRNSLPNRALAVATLGIYRALNTIARVMLTEREVSCLHQ